ncbi:hypothetical protein RPE78_08905 [Thioclava litoralis]|uniref:Uncharacterized protein n=1 Tax=Thioclava litoralis TaxID=3076557 RepID=A0ABZ1DZG4_9RHOB|nr:hypothetical protein RPE78_08905 [Thioclava sp. FTW29]
MKLHERAGIIPHSEEDQCEMQRHCRRPLGAFSEDTAPLRQLAFQQALNRYLRNHPDSAKRFLVARWMKAEKQGDARFECINLMYYRRIRLLSWQNKKAGPLVRRIFRWNRVYPAMALRAAFLESAALACFG